MKIVIAITMVVFGLAFLLSFLLSKTSVDNENSKRILNMFSPNDTSETLTEMIKFHQKNGNIEYKLD